MTFHPQEAGDSPAPGIILVYFLLGPSVFLCTFVSVISTMITAGLHYSQTNKISNSYTATSSSMIKPRIKPQFFLAVQSWWDNS